MSLLPGFAMLQAKSPIWDNKYRSERAKMFKKKIDFSDLPLFKSNIHLKVCDIYVMYFKHWYVILSQLRKSYGDVYSLFLGSKPTVVINGLKAMKEALVTKGIDFAGRPQDLFINHAIKRSGKTRMICRTVENVLSNFANFKKVIRYSEYILCQSCLFICMYCVYILLLLILYIFI